MTIYKNINNNELLSTLKKLYRQLSMAIARIRSHSYRFSFESKNNFDITSVLNKQVDKLAARAISTISDKSNLKEQKNNLVNGKKRVEDHQVNKIINVSGIETEFSRYLKQRKSNVVSQPHMGDKLKASAWEHIHSAIRYAKQGKIDTAKLHADIAGHALEESGHYLTNKEYSDLINQVEQYFTDQQIQEM